MEVALPSTGLVFLAGVLTVATPCVIPILPPMLAGSVGSRLRPLAIVAGMAVTFTLMGGIFSALGIAAGSSGGVLRYAAIAFIMAFGAVMVNERLNRSFVLLTSSLVGKLSSHLPMEGSRESFSGAFVLGLLLGIVWIPCVGPVLGAVLSYVTLGGDVLQGSFMLLTYSVGLGIPMLAIAYGGKGASSRMEWFREHSGKVEKFAGWVIILTGIAMLLGLDKYIQAKLLPYFPVLL